jgi:integrase
MTPDAFSPEVLAALEIVRKAFGNAAPAPGHTVKKLWELYEKAESCRIKSFDRSRDCARLFLSAFGDRQASSITLFDIDAWRAEDRNRITCRGQTPKPATRNRVLIVFRRLLNWSVDRGLLVSNPLNRLKMEPERNIRQTVLTDADVDKLIDAADPFMKVIIRVLYETGMRRGEVLNLRHEQIDEAHSCIRLGAGQTKNGRPRVVRLSTRALAALKSVPRIEGAPHVFCVGASNAMCHRPWARHLPHPERLYNVRHVYGLYKDAVDAAGLKGVNGEEITMHCLRHSFIAKARRLRIPERVVMAQSGHLTRVAFDRYGATVADDELASAIAVMESGEVHHAS